MKQFTFAMITYNQEKYVLEHLESIKYQILNYGNNYSINLLVSDDSSKDDTVYLINNWLKVNCNLFDEIVILTAENNVGIVKNFIKALKHIKTNKYKILAGDDLYFKYSVFDIDNSVDFVLTPFIMFRDDSRKIVKRKKKDIIKYDEYILNEGKNKLFDLIKADQYYENHIEAPTVFMKYSVIDNGLYEALKDYSWIEDVPMWHYLFYKKKDTMKTSFDPIPKVLYRCDVGISVNKSHPKRNGFSEDLLRIEKLYSSNALGRHYWKLKKSIVKSYIKYFYSVFDKRIIDFERNYIQYENEAEEYLELIKNNVQEYKEQNK